MTARTLVNLVTLVSVTALSLLVLALMASLIVEPLCRGLPVILREGASFFTKPPALPGVEEVGGVIYPLLGTLLMTLLALAFVTPLGLLSGIYLSEYSGDPLSKLVEKVTQLLAEVPSVILGIFIYTTVVLFTGGSSLIAGALSLSLAIAPYVVVQTKEVLASIPPKYREAVFALGLPKWKAVLLVLLPMNARGIVTALLMAYLRALGETAPVLFTAGAAFSGFYGLFGPSSTLSLLVWTYGQSPFPNWQELAWGASFLLIAMTVFSSLALKALVREVRL